jgi:predicted kinase
MNISTIVLVTGHPGTGKTTLAKVLALALKLPLTGRDQFKETLLDTLGWSTEEWANKLSIASWTLLYQQIERLLEAGVDQIVESNFDPRYANSHWQRLRQQYSFRLIQIRCEANAEVLLSRYHQRIADGTRHAGHINRSDDATFLAIIRNGPMSWIDIDSIHLSVDTTIMPTESYSTIVESLKQLMANA